MTLSNDELTRALAEARISLGLAPICDLRQRTRGAWFAKAEGTAVFAGAQLEAFALQEGRSRELAVYLYDLTAAALSATGNGEVYFPLAPRDIEDQTLADSLRQIAERHRVAVESTTLVVPLGGYFATATRALPALLSLRHAGFGLAVAIDPHHTPRFRPLSELPVSAFCLSGAETWRRLRTIGPGRLGLLGSWIGWAEVEGLKRIACDIADARGEETARLYGFTFAAGPLYSAKLHEAQAPAIKRSSG